MAINPEPEAAALTLPAAPGGCSWRKVVDTGAAPPEDAMPDGPVFDGGAQLSLRPTSGLLLIAVPADAPGRMI